MVKLSTVTGNMDKTQKGRQQRAYKETTRVPANILNGALVVDSVSNDLSARMSKNRRA